MNKLTNKPTIRIDGVRCAIVDGPRWRPDGTFALELEPIGLRFRRWMSNTELGLPAVQYQIDRRTNGQAA